MQADASNGSTLEGFEAVLRARKSTRAFHSTPVSLEKLRAILELASTAPSNSNTQPWHVYALAGDAKAALSQALELAFDTNDAPPPSHFPEQVPPVMQNRQADFGARYYTALDISQTDAAARAAQTRRNYAFFGAPIGIIYTIEKCLRPHSWLDLGLFVQNVMIAAQAHGLNTCPQVSFARFHSVIARALKLPDDEMVACGMSLGYGDEQAPVNGFRMPRCEVDDFARTFGFDQRI